MIRLPLLFAAFCTVYAYTSQAAQPYQIDDRRIAELAAQAPEAMQKQIVSVADKQHPYPGDSINNYVSYSRYHWPDPKKEDGLPYISTDGKHNLDQVARGDWQRFWDFANSTRILACAWYLNADQQAAERAAQWLRTWFITPETRMNPHLEYAQIILGRNNNRGRPSGILDTRGLSQVIDALRMLEGSATLSDEEQLAIRNWFETYLDWLINSDLGRRERSVSNNHATWYLVQAISIALYCEQNELARELAEENKTHIDAQIAADGSQPKEINRVDGLMYSLFNLDAHAQVAQLSSHIGVDLWNYTTPEGSGMQRAVDYLRPYSKDPQSWPTSQNASMRPGFLYRLIRQADAAKESLTTQE